MRIIMRTTIVVWTIAEAFTTAHAAEAPLIRDFAPQAMMESCATDLGQHCSNVQPGGGRFIICLQQNAAAITPQCRAAVEPSDGADAKASIHVTVSGIKPSAGTLVIMLTDDPQTFPAGRRVIRLPAGHDTVAAVFKDLKPNTYAVTALHDRNNNNEFDSGATPNEAHGSVNASEQPASFANSSLKVTGDVQLTLSLKYH